MIIIIVLVRLKCLPNRSSYAMGGDVTFHMNTQRNHERKTNVGAIFLSPLWCYVFFLSSCCLNERIVVAIPDGRRPKARFNSPSRDGVERQKNAELQAGSLSPTSAERGSRATEYELGIDHHFWHKKVFVLRLYLYKWVFLHANPPPHIHSLDTVHNTAYSFFLIFYFCGPRKLISKSTIASESYN